MQIAISPSHAKSAQPFLSWRRKLCRESLILLGFLVLTVVMTWPWALHLRDGVKDENDPYAYSYLLWWDYHQTFHDPLNLFQATVFYPYRDTLAFGENGYGVALVFFPLFALGLRPLTVQCIAAFLGFPFSAYCMFRLARTLSASNAIAWVAGIVFAFIPYRFQYLSMVPSIFTGWVPLLFEAVVLYARERTWRRASWLAVAFVMNALTSLTWFILTLVPLAITAIIGLTLYRAWRDRAFWLQTTTTLGAPCLVLLPFLLPFYRVSRAWHFVRTPADVQVFSAHLINWLAVDRSNKLWQGLGAVAADPEMVLFPGLLPPLLALAAFLLITPQKNIAPRIGSFLRKVLVWLDLTAIISGVVAVVAFGYGRFKLTALGLTLLSVNGPKRALVILLVVLVIRCALARPQVLSIWLAGKNTFNRIRSSAYFELNSFALIWIVVGFMGSFGMNLFFHRALFNLVPLFRSLRVASRWAMICYVGLALLAGLGALRVAQLLNRHWRYLPTSLICSVVVIAILFEQRVAPLPLVHGQADADELTLYLKTKTMSGGIVDLPPGKHRYLLRAADHGHPFVSGANSFAPPLERQLEIMTMSEPIPDQLLDVLEATPASYVAVHSSFISPERRTYFEDFLKRGMDAGRLRFVISFQDRLSNGLLERNDLYAVVKTEPAARTEGPPPAPLSFAALQPSFSALLQHFEEKSFFVYRLFRVSFGSAPRFDEFIPRVQSFGDSANANLAQNQSLYVDGWMNLPEFRSIYDSLNDEAYVDALIAHARLTSNEVQRDVFVRGLREGTLTRAAVLRQLANNQLFLASEFNTAFVLMHYFAYLQRDPDDVGQHFWLNKLNHDMDHRDFTEAFAASTERQLKLAQP